MAALIATTAITADAARKYYQDGETPEGFIETVNSDQALRASKHVVLSTKKHLLDSVPAWTCGVQAFETVYDADDHCIALHIYGKRDGEMGHPFGKNKVVGKQVLSKEVKGAKITVERFGNYTMLVMRNAAGQPIKAFYKIPNEFVQGQCRNIFLRRILAGNYVLESGEHALFGPKMSHYTEMKWAEDPGYHYEVKFTDDRKSIDIIYGEGRVSHGDPSSDRYGKMPGGGGAGAIMGPMTIRITPIVGGLKVKSIHDEPFVSHDPSFKDDPTITIFETPYTEIPGKYAFASAMPLTHSLLRLFPKDVLAAIRNEINARHGASFADAEVQNYFNAQPWYKNSGKKAVVLTDIEKFNVALIKQIEKEK